MHGPYSAFNISDPKPRNIHKATVRDRVLHHLIHKELYCYFDERFIFDSYSCRKNKGTHKALNRLRSFARKASQNHTRTCYVLKCDIQKFFASVDQAILRKILERHIADSDIRWVIHQVISSFYVTAPGIGLPLGNLTSQLLVNIYMHEFDAYLKEKLRVKYYLRYADDFVILSDNKEYLEKLLPLMRKFLNEKLRLMLHKDKVYIKTIASGVDFLGWVHFPYHRVLRTSTKRRIFQRVTHNNISSYLGTLSHGNSYGIQKQVLKNLNG